MQRSIQGHRRSLLLCLAASLGLAALPAHASSPAAPVRDGALVLVLGDSISAEYGLKRGTGWVALFERRLAEERISARVVNASISGETTAGGRSRLPALLAQHKPSHVVIELGGNDALRGLALAMTESNLSQMVELSKKAGARVLLVGIQVPPNYGQAYADRLVRLFPDIGRRHQVAVVPSILKGIAEAPDPQRLFQADRIHPTEEAQAVILTTMWPALKKLLTPP